MKINKKRDVKRIFAFIFLGLFVVSLVASQANGQKEYDKKISEGTKNLFARWLEGIAPSKLQAKILSLLIIFVIITVLLVSVGLGTFPSLLISLLVSFLFTWFATPESIINILKSYKPVPLIIKTLIPTALFFVFTYVAVTKNKEGLIVAQRIVWFVAFVFFLITGIIDGWYLVSPLGLADTISNLTKSEKIWLLISYLISIGISAFFALRNRDIIRMIFKQHLAVKKLKAAETEEDIQIGMKLLSETAEAATGEKK